jgi:Domain of unknown function (DUF4136)
MQSRTRGLALGACLIALAGCAGQRISTDYSPSVGFTQYRTFALVSRPDSASHELLDDRVRNAVEAQLASKGLSETDREGADLHVGYGVVDRRHKEIYTSGYGGGWGGWGWGGWGWRRWGGVAWPTSLESNVETYTDGTVIVTLMDAKTRKVVWQGQADGVIDLPVSNPAKATRSIDEAVSKIFAKYPPPSA